MTPSSCLLSIEFLSSSEQIFQLVQQVKIHMKKKLMRCNYIIVCSVWLKATDVSFPYSGLNLLLYLVGSH